MIRDKKKLFLFDIDGTLFDNANNEVPPSTINALEELKFSAHLGIATGRAQFMLYSIDKIIHLFDDFVFINGQYIVSENKVVYENTLDFEKIEKLFTELESRGIAYGFMGSHDEAISKIDEKVIKSFGKLGLNLPPVDKEYYKHNNVYQSWVFCDETVAEEMKEKYPEFQFIRWMDVGYDILPKSSSKGLGMKKLAEYLGIPLEDVVVFGDGDNDFEMIRDAGLGIAMGNATDKVKSVAKYITSNVGEEGIINALRHFKFIK